MENHEEGKKALNQIKRNQITQLMQENTEEEINSAQKDEGPSQDTAINCSPSIFVIEKEEISSEKEYAFRLFRKLKDADDNE